MAGHPPFEPQAHVCFTTPECAITCGVPLQTKVTAPHADLPEGYLYVSSVSMWKCCMKPQSQVNKGITKVNFPNKMKGVVQASCDNEGRKSFVLRSLTRISSRISARRTLDVLSICSNR